MAEIHLHESETYCDRLPELCMPCGEPATTHIRRNFAWVPPWVGATAMVPLLYIILATSMKKSMVVEVPTCHKHRNYFLMRQIWTWVSFVALGLIAGGAFALAAATEVEEAMAPACVLGALGFVVWVIVAIVIQALMIKPTEITDRMITLKCVHEGFASALRDMQDDREYGRRRRRFDEDDFDDRPRRRPPPRGDSDEPRPRRDGRTDIRTEGDDEPPRRDGRTDIRPKREFEE